MNKKKLIRRIRNIYTEFRLDWQRLAERLSLLRHL
jgi:hypothetical protein